METFGNSLDGERKPERTRETPCQEGCSLDEPGAQTSTASFELLDIARNLFFFPGNGHA